MKNRDHAGVLVPPPLLFVLPLLATTMLPARLGWPIIQEGATVLTLGAVLALATGVAIGLASVASFRTANTTILPAGRPTTAIVGRGPYGFTRNPMYLGMALAYFGLALLLNNGWALALLPIVLVVIDRAVIRREERYLTAKFGQPYRDYCNRVRRWL